MLRAKSRICELLFPSAFAHQHEHLNSLPQNTLNSIMLETKRNRIVCHCGIYFNIHLVNFLVTTTIIPLTQRNSLLKLINDSWKKYRGLMSVWKSDGKLLKFASLIWEVISSVWHSVSASDETPWSSAKILGCTLYYFQLSSPCFIWWWNNASHAWYIAYLNRQIKLFKTQCLSCMIMSEEQISLRSLVCRDNLLHSPSLSLGILFNGTALGIH